MGQKHDPFLYDTLLEVGFGKSFAYKRYVSALLCHFILYHYVEIQIYVEIVCCAINLRLSRNREYGC